jgi:hypothetical protein
MYMIALGLSGKHEEYGALETAIKALGPWSNRMPETWIVETRISAKRIRDLLKVHLEPGDRLFVGQFTKNWAGTNMGPSFPEWMGRRTFDDTKPQQGQGHT